MKNVFLILALSLIFSLTGQNIWYNQRFSALTGSGEIGVRCEITAANETLLLSATPEGILQQPMIEMEFLPLTYQGFMLGAEEAERAWGIRSLLLDSGAGVPTIHVIPVIQMETGTPELTELTWLADDIIGDITLTESFLDLTALYMSYDTQNLYLAMTNQDGGFPVSAAAWGPFYSYMAVISPPDGEYPLFGMLNTVDMPPYIQPGLYKITGTSMDDLELIGNIGITEDVENNLLVLQCEWSVLLADADFTSWYDPENPQFFYLVTTGKITLTGGLEEGDLTETCVVYPQPLIIEPQVNVLPEISGFQISDDDKVEMQYFDANANFALTAQVVFNDGSMLELFPHSYDYNLPVLYKSLQSHPLLISNTWEWLTLRVSDNDFDFVESTYNNDSDISENDLWETDGKFSCYPNPFNPATTIYYEFSEEQPATIVIYNLKGEVVRRFPLAGRTGEIYWDGSDYQGRMAGSGIYLLQLQTETQRIGRKVMLLK